MYAKQTYRKTVSKVHKLPEKPTVELPKKKLVRKRKLKKA